MAGRQIRFPPGLKPSRRTYRPGRIPSNRFVALNGATTILRYGDRLVDAELELQFQNIPDGQAAEVLRLYREASRTDDWFSFSQADVSGGAGQELARWIESNNGGGLRWRFDPEQEPSVESVRPGRSTLTCSFIGELDA